MPRLIAEVTDAGYPCKIWEDDDGRVHYVAKAAIDADGANGQHGEPAAYRDDDSGSDYLANAGMGIRLGKVVCIHSWARDIVILGTDKEPKVFLGGRIASMTRYKYPNLGDDDPNAYVDAETIPYVVAPPSVIQKTAGVVIGCRARVSWSGHAVDCVVADVGPENSVGEISIAAARALGIPESPRDGGRDTPDVNYELWPGDPAPGFILQPA